MYTNLQLYQYFNSLYNFSYPSLYYNSIPVPSVPTYINSNTLITPNNQFLKLQAEILPIQQNEKLSLAQIQKPQVKKRKKCQNPYRNILTNIGNQLFGFILCRKKSYSVLEKINPQLNEQWEYQLYQYVKKLKRSFGCYFNIAKLKILWFGDHSIGKIDQFHKVIRIISNYFIQQKLVISFLTSQKLSKQLKTPLMKARRILLDLLAQKIDINEMPLFQQSN